MRFSKIKYDGVRVELAWTTKAPGREVQSSLSSTEEPLPEFRDALRAFIPLVVDLLDCHFWDQELRATGVSINEEENDGRIGCVVTCRKSVDGANSPLILNTPHLRERVDEPEDRAGFLPDGWVEAIERLDKAAQDYLDRKRAQTEMFAPPSDATEAAPAGAGAE